MANAVSQHLRPELPTRRIGPRENQCKAILGILLGTGFLISHYFLSVYSYLLFHSFVELTTVAITGALFLLAWNSRRFTQDDAFVFLGCTNISIGIVILLHTLAYKGMGILATGKPRSEIYELREPDGQTTHQALLLSPPRDESCSVFQAIAAGRAMNELQEYLEEKVVLIKELHHRVKNNLQIVASLLNLQANRSQSHKVLDVLRDTENRVRSMALLHELLYRSENLARIDLGNYVEQLCTQILRSSGPGNGQIHLDRSIVPVSLPLEQAVPCGLIINELVSNALKHAFPDGRVDRIQVDIHPTEERQLFIGVTDDGVGFQRVADAAKSSTLGLHLVSGLVRQLRGKFDAPCRDGQGAAFNIVFAMPEEV